MALCVLEFVSNPGRRFEIHEVLTPVPDETDDLRAVGDVHLDGVAFAQLGTLYLDVEMRTTISQPCGRCARPLDRPFTLHESFTVPIPPTADAVDVRPMVVSLILSAHNPHVLCRADCRGLCPACGADLNETQDHVCTKAPPSSQRLRDFLSS
jgi:uncharacterized metal-binding protein YceD (DUF177 family)